MRTKTSKVNDIFKRHKGIWLIEDNSEKLLIYLGKKESYPILAINYMKHINDVSKIILSLMDNNHSINDMSTEICKFFASIASDEFVEKKNKED